MNCFNGEKYLREAIKSVLNQSYTNWELIFWDNLSTDKSGEIFKSFNDVRLKYYRASTHANILYTAKNFALKKANGDFIAFLDVDDWWLPKKLETQIPLFKDNEVGIVYGNFYRFFEKKNKKKIFRKKLPSGNILDYLLNDYVIGSPTYVIRKKILEEKNCTFDNRYHIIGDFDLNIRIASKWKIGCVQNPTAFARIHGKNESLLNKEKEIEELKNWHYEAKSNHIISKSKEFNKIPLKISYLEISNNVLKDKFSKNFLKVLKYPLSLNKIKLIIALFLPKFILRKIRIH